MKDFNPRERKNSEFSDFPFPLPVSHGISYFVEKQLKILQCKIYPRAVSPFVKDLSKGVWCEYIAL